MRGNTVRKQVLVFAGAALLLLSAAVVWFVLRLPVDDRSLDEMERIGLLLIAQDEAGAARVVSLVILSEHGAAGLCLPVDLRLRAEDGGLYRADELLAELGPDATRDAVEALFGIGIPFHMVVGLDQIAAWVDGMGGVPIALDATAIYDDRSSGAPILMEFRPGIHVLDGDEVIAFLIEPSIDGHLDVLGRQAALLEALLTHGLPSDPLPRSAVELAREVLPRVRTRLAVGQMAQVIDRVRGIPAEAVQAGALIGAAVEIDGETYTQPQIVETERMLRALLSGEEWIKPEDIFVSLFNGNWVRRVAATTGDYLQAKGFRIGEISNADHFGYDKSLIIVLTEEPKAWVLRDALPWEAEIVFPQAMASTMEALGGLVPLGTDLLLILGGRTEF